MYKSQKLQAVEGVHLSLVSYAKVRPRALRKERQTATGRKRSKLCSHVARGVFASMNE